MLDPSMENFLKAHEQEAYELLLTLAQIPAPSNHEEERARFCLEWLRSQGAKAAYIDEAQNVVCPVDDDGAGPFEVYMAHTDVVFPDTEPLPLRAGNGRIFCPGIGDDTACLVCVLLAAKYALENAGTARWHQLRAGRPGLLFVCNSGEEGLGNLKGVRRICQDFGGRIEALCTFDSTLDKVIDRAVGSRRFRVTVRTEGGHSFNDFGRANAIERLAAIVREIYMISVPEGGKTTYNVGMISGGTSVNTIAQEAWLLYEFRSDRRENLERMQQLLDEVIARVRAAGTCVEIELIGERPCEGEVDPERRRALVERGLAVVERAVGKRPVLLPGSTDCNIPLSLGIPAVCLGSFYGAGAHTREEYVEASSLAAGYRAAFEMIFG